MSNVGANSGGRVIVGLESKQLGEIEQQNQEPLWSEENIENYVQRVKERARNVARDIINEAMREGEEIKAEAYNEGIKKGREEARAEEENRVAEFRENMRKALQDISEGREKIWADYRNDLLLLTQAAVEKTLGIELEEERQKIVSSLWEEALQLLESGQDITLRVRPEDKEVMQEAVAAWKEGNPRIGNVQVVPSRDLSKGGVVVESDSGIVDNSIQTRLDEVRGILDSITVGNSED